MTLATPDRLHVDRQDWLLLAGIAVEASRTPEVFVEEGLIATIGAARVMMANRKAGINETLVVVGNFDSEFRIADDLEEVFKERAEDVEKERREEALEEKESIIDGVNDPFASDERLVVALPDPLLIQVEEASRDLGVVREVFVKVAVDLRFLLYEANEAGDRVLLSTHEEGVFEELATSFVA